jgi:DNA segregation ATPase FtsK/SpoIIIE, S-DNA-T family
MCGDHQYELLAAAAVEAVRRRTSASHWGVSSTGLTDRSQGPGSQDGGVDRCEQCDFMYDELGISELPDTIRSLGTAYRSRLESGVDDAEQGRLLRRRPAPQVWSALEYSCHFRDVLLAQRERLYLALVEDTPRFWSIHRDERVILARYSDDSLEEVAPEVDLAANLIARAFARLDDAQWQRRCIYGYPAPARRTVAWLARHTVHEGRHHLRDIDNVIRATRSTVESD